MDRRERRAVLLAAWINGALIALIPFGMAISSVLSEDQPVRPPGVSGLPPLLQMLPLVYALGGLGALVGWRTYVHARAYIDGLSKGWLAILEPAALGFAIALFLLRTGIRTNPGAAPPYIAAYGAIAVVVGLLIGLVLRLIAVLTLRLASGRGFAAATNVRPERRS